MKGLSLSLLLALFLFLSTVTTAFAMDNKKDCKTEWPELEGKSKEEAERVIQEQEPDLTVQVVPVDAMVTMDYRTDRVRVRVNDKGQVSGTPKVG